MEPLRWIVGFILGIPFGIIAAFVVVGAIEMMRGIAGRIREGHDGQ